MDHNTTDLRNKQIAKNPAVPGDVNSEVMYEPSVQLITKIWNFIKENTPFNQLERTYRQVSPGFGTAIVMLEIFFLLATLLLVGLPAATSVLIFGGITGIIGAVIGFLLFLIPPLIIG